MLIKSAIIFVLFLGLIAYAQTPDVPECSRYSLPACKSALVRAGYIEVAQSNEPRRLLIETFALRGPAKASGPVLKIQVTSRDDLVIDVTHYESNEAQASAR